jgi:hypothetical protein
VESIRDEVLNADSVIRWFERKKDASGLVGALQHWCVADWSPEWIRDFGADVPGAKEGPTALTNFMFIHALEELAPLLELLGKPGRAANYLKKAQKLRKLAHQTFWNKKEGVYVDSPRHAVFSQLTNAWALLLGLPKGKKKAAALAEAIARKPGMCRAAYFGQFYVFEAWKKAGRPDLIVEAFASYRQLVEKHVSTWPEDLVGGRSECHAWSNAATYQLLGTILGFTIAAPGCRRMSVRPWLEGLTRAAGCFVTPRGPVALDYDQARKKPFRLSVPAGVKVDFSYQDIDQTFEMGEHSF